MEMYIDRYIQKIDEGRSAQTASQLCRETNHLEQSESVSQSIRSGSQAFILMKPVVIRLNHQSDSQSFDVSQ